MEDDQIGIWSIKETVFPTMDPRLFGEAISLSNGQICTMTVVATDSMGFEHHYSVDHWVVGSDSQRGPLFDDEKIYSADGNLLWETEYQ